MAYPEAIRYLESFVNYEKKSQYHYKRLIKLGRIKELLEILGNPQGAFKCIHVAGTKGKGSTCAFIAYILREAGYKAGLYTSPHLSDFRERIRILPKSPIAYHLSPEFEGMISRQALSRLVWRLKPTIDKYNKDSKYGPLTFFEVYTALAFVYFKEKKADFAVLETGLGGRLDATNVVNSLVCAITPISLEHTKLLGNTIAKIAKEKSGIIKKCQVSGVKCQPIVISAPQEKEAAAVIRKRCRHVGVKLYEVGRDIIYNRVSASGGSALGGKGQGLRVKGILGEYNNLKIKLIGAHQVINATTAIGAVEALRFNGVKIGAGAIRKGLYRTLWPGRCEVISRKPLVILDGAQNVASAMALGNVIKEDFSAGGGSACGGSYKKLILVFGVCCDKDILGIAKELFPMADEVILTKANSPRAAEPEFIQGQGVRVKGQGKIHLTKNVKEAIEKAREIAEAKDLILVTGSLFVVGEARETLVK